jgi:hypothetical protein
MATNTFLKDLFSRRGKQSDSNTIWLLNGAKIVDFSEYEPDANTHRGDYYYNSKLNVLYRKTKLTNKFCWKPISN